MSEEVCDFSGLERFNLHDYYLQRNLDEGRGDKVCLYAGDEARTYAELEERVARCGRRFVAFNPRILETSVAI